MADVTTSNLYPPIIESFMPAFIADGDDVSCIIKFEIPDTNNINEINQSAVQVILKNQKNNVNSLSKTKAPAGVLLKTMYQDDVEDGFWYIVLYSSDLADNKFYQDQLYKLQLRFTSIDVRITENTVPNAAWISANINGFSEWSTVCLLKGISEPYLNLKSLILNSGDNILYCNSPFLNLNEKLQFKGGATENEYLAYYKVELYTVYNDYESLIEESDIIYNSEDTLINKIQYKFKHLLAGMDSSHLEENYRLKIYITTNNFYTQTFEYDFIASAVEGYDPTIVFNITPDVDQGRMKISFSIHSELTPPTIDGGTKKLNYAIVHRTSNKNNFTYATGALSEEWDELAKIRLTDSDFANSKILTFYDNTIEAGNFYRYGIRLSDAKESVTSIFKSEEEVTIIDDTPVIEKVYHICDFEDVFLNGDYKQLKMRYDSRVTSYKRVVMENKVETIGSQYPIIRRNTSTNYKQFAINGLITFHTDDANIFLSEQEIYGGRSDIKNKYINHNIENGITPYTDYTKEREFREKVIDFLCSGKPMLLRTMTEGNVLVRLMDINITPNQSLNNLICSFTANALEIAEANFENYDKYNIFSKTNLKVTHVTPDN